MKYSKKPKYKLDRKKITIRDEKDLTPRELYEEILRSKQRKRH